MLTIQYELAFKKDFKRMLKRGYNGALLERVLNLLVKGEALPPRYKDHALKGNWRHYRECHILPDWLLIYRIREEELYLLLVRTGTHSDLF